MPKISVIIPMYKTPKLRLRKCLESLMEQTFKDFEVLIIDDGNEPGYEYIKEEYEQKDSRIKFIRQEHSGVSAARNLGLASAQGEYIAFVDSDDYADPLYLEELHEAMQDADVAICAVSEQYYPVYPGWTDCRVFWSKPSFYNGLQYINFCHNKMYKTSIIRENNIIFKPGVKLGEDAIFLADYLQKCKSFRKVREPRYHYVPDSNSAVHRYREEFWLWEQQVVQRQWELFHQYPLSVFEEQAMERWLFEKLLYTITYYSDRERDPKKRKAHFEEIYNSELFTRLMQCKLNKKHKHLGKYQMKIIRTWKCLGIRGFSLIRFFRHLRWKLHI